MDSMQSQAMNLPATPPQQGLLRPFSAWSPVFLVVLAVAYGLTVLWLQPVPDYHPQQLAHPAGMITSEGPRQTRYVEMALNDLLQDGRWQTVEWSTTGAHRSGIGYLSGPATFHFTLDNPAQHPVERLIVVAAPFLDHIAPVAIDQEGNVTTLIAMGDTSPFHQRYYDLPQWIWPVTLAPGSSTSFLFEVRNAGPTMFPVSVQSPESIIGHGAFSLVWKAFVAGILAFALLFNLVIVAMLRRPGLAWLSVLMVGVIHSQLVIEGFGLWLLWPQWPAINGLIGISLPLCLIAICQFTPHFMELPRFPTRVLHGLSLAALFILVTSPWQLTFAGQGSLLVVAISAGLYVLGMVTRRLKTHVYARYYALSILSIFIGAVAASLRTIGWLPVNSVTDSAFFLGAAGGSIILTMGVGRQLLEERRRRLSATFKAHQEQQLRSRIEKDYDRLLTTHRVTGKPNRPILEETLDRLHDQKRPYTLGVIRLERFNEIEQALGYRAAEDLLRNYLRRLNSFLKQRFGDQLVMFNGFALATIDTINHAFACELQDEQSHDKALWRDLSEWLASDFTEGRYVFNWNPSVGLAHAPEHGQKAADMISCAGVASLDSDRMVKVYDSTVADRQFRQQVLMLDLESALKNNEIQLQYQPKVSIRTSQVVACEALIRWHHSEFGLVPPGQWIPLAEKFGVIHPVTFWVVEQVCRDLPLLQERHGPALNVAVNISALDLAQPAFADNIVAILDRYRIPPTRLILEITETAMMSNTEQARQVIHSLSELGFSIALDDFGTGHSSLSALANFDLDELKIDRSFLDGILTHPVRQRIFHSALELGDALDLDVVVEGVESEEVACWLQQFPGLYGQGYYWGKPESLKP